MPFIPYVKKKIGSSYLIWMQNSNSYFQLEEPAWFVFNKIAKRYKLNTIAKVFSFRYEVSMVESLAFVMGILEYIDKFNSTISDTNVPSQITEDLEHYHFNSYSKRHFLIGEKLITFIVELQLFENYLHPLIAHLEVFNVLDNPNVFELFSFEKKLIFRFNGKVNQVWLLDETLTVRSSLLIFLLNLLYDKTDNEWLLTVHASALTNGKKTVMFTAPAGSGKTTIAALLQMKGFLLISDDIVPIDRNLLRAYPLPAAMSVKQGSMDLLSSHYPNLADKKTHVLTTEKLVKYLEPKEILTDFKSAVHPVKEIIFIEYNPAVDFIFQKMELPEAIRLLLDQVWVHPSKGNPALFFDWITQVKFYKLVYSDNDMAINSIVKLYEDE